MTIFALGGGDLAALETLPIDRLIVQETGKDKPNALFIPTASSDDMEYVETFKRAYGDAIGCPVDQLLLWRDELTENEIQAKIDWADLVYVGGGNTRKLLEMWRSRGVDRMLKKAAERGCVLSGLSAGANCWFKHANSDAPIMEGRTDILTMKLDCLAFVDLTLCPHMAREEFRPSEFRKMMETTEGVGIGVDDCAALQIKGETFRVVQCQPWAGIHILWNESGAVRHERIVASNTFQPISDLRAMCST